MAQGSAGQNRAGASRRLGPTAGCVAVVVALGFGMAWGGRLIESRQEVAVAGAKGPRLPLPASAEMLQVTPPSKARALDGRNSEVVPRGRASGWQRLPPRPPLGASSLAALAPEPPAPVVPAAPDPGSPRRTLLFGPVATAAGRIEVAGHVIELEGIRLVDPAEQCKGQGGGSWPCGTVARAAFRAWMRGRAVECVVTPLPLPKPVFSQCFLGGKDMGAWLVSQGFAEAAQGGAYEQEGQEARAAHRGIFGAEPKKPAPAPALVAGAEPAGQPGPAAEASGEVPAEGPSEEAAAPPRP